jgi:hypothetical protein
MGTFDTAKEAAVVYDNAASSSSSSSSSLENDEIEINGSTGKNDNAASSSSSSSSSLENGEIEIIGSTGKNALSDIPHARFDCVNFIFNKDPLKYCDQCYCYVCETLASECNRWIAGWRWASHCSASHQDKSWREERKRVRANKQKQEEEERLVSQMQEDELGDLAPKIGLDEEEITQRVHDMKQAWFHCGFCESNPLFSS